MMPPSVKPSKSSIDPRTVRFQSWQRLVAATAALGAVWGELDAALKEWGKLAWSEEMIERWKASDRAE